MKFQKAFMALLLAMALVGSTGCASTPVNVSNVGVASFHARQVLIAIGTLQDITIAARQNDVINVDDARKVISATEKAGKAGQQLEAALRAGLGAENAKAQAIAVIRQELVNLPTQVSEKTRTVIAPYVGVAIAALTIFDGK